MPFQTQALNELAATITGAASAAAEANALAQNAQQKNELIIAGDAVEVNTDYTMDGTKAVVIADTATAAADITITLPDAALNDGKLYWIKRTGGTHTLLVVPQGSQTIDGLAQVPGGFAQNASILVVAIGDNWTLLSQSIGTPPLLAAQVITADATLDPSIPYWLLDATSNPVTLTLPPVATVEGQQFTFTCLNADHDATIAAAAGEFLYLVGKPAASTLLGRDLGGMTLVLVARLVPALPGLWVSQGIINPYPPAKIFPVDTTSSGGSLTLPDASISEGLWRAYQNTGTGGHALVMSPRGSDTIDGGPGPLVITDSNLATFLRDDQNATNWVSILTAGGTFPTSVEAFAEDTTSADVPVSLPLAASSGGLLVLYKNTGTGGHNVVVSPAGGSDTIDGGLLALTVVDDHWAGFVREDGSTSNWVSVVEPVIPAPPVIPPAPVFTGHDTTGGDVSVTLPAASASVGMVVGHENQSATDFDAVIVSPAGSDTIEGGAGPVRILGRQWAIFAVEDGTTTNWVRLLPSARGALGKTFDTTAVGLIWNLPQASDSAGLLRSYRNIGTGGHALTVRINDIGSDTIDGGTADVLVADGQTATFVRDVDVATNWILISLV